MAFGNKGSVRTRKDGSVELRIYVNGEQKSFYGKSEADARRAHRKYVNDLKKVEEEYANTSTAIDIKFADYAHDWLTTYKYGSVANSTYDRLESAYDVHLKESELGNKKITDISTGDIQKFINSKKETLSLSSIKKLKEILSPCLNHAYITHVISVNPMNAVVMPKNKSTSVIQEKKVEIYTDSEINKIGEMASAKYFSTNPRRYRYSPLFLFILNTGLRIGEALALTWEDIDFQNRTININKSITVYKNRESQGFKKVQAVGTTKTVNGMRCIPLNDTASECLREMRKRNLVCNIHGSLIFSNYDGELLSIRSVQKTFVNICEEAGIKHKGIHALRHTFGSVLIRNKVDIKIVSDLLGHSDVRFTYNRYIHIINEQKAQAIALINIGNGSIEQGYNKGIRKFEPLEPKHLSYL